MINVEMLDVKKCFWCGSSELTKIAKRKDDIAVQECAKCQLIMVASVPEDLSVYYTDEDYFNPDGDTETGYHENYDLISPFYLYWQGAFLDEIARHGKKSSLLEVGCATGSALEMTRQFNPGLKLYGIDLSPYAIDICHQKGLEASVSKINGFHAPAKFDLIFSSETMEHVDELRDFVEGVKSNLADDGVYIFYVPAVDRKALIAESQEYPSLTTSLEHISYFTKSFLESALTHAFGAPAYVYQVEDTAGENYAIGVVSKDESLTEYAQKVIEGFLDQSAEFDSPKSFYNLAVISSKFAKFELAQYYLQEATRKGLVESKLNFLKGIISYNKGELSEARKLFVAALGDGYADNFNLKVLLAVERELNSFYQADLAQLGKLEVRTHDAETELGALKQSRLVRTAIFGMKVVRKLRIMLPIFKKKALSKGLNLFRRLVPIQLRRPIAYLVKLKWLVKQVEVVNQPWPTDRAIVSVVITYYNRASTIDETIGSLRKQTFRHFEVIIVNDGSTERASIDKLEALDLSGLSARIINQDNAGVAAARNTGIAQAQGKYIVSLDSDDLLDPTYIEKALVALETDPTIDLITTDMRLFGVDNLVYKQAAYSARHLLENNMLITSAMFVKEGWEKAGGYKSGIGYEDWEFWISLAELGYWGRRIPEPLFNYRTAVSSRFVDDRAKHGQNLRSIKKLHPFFSYRIKKVGRSKAFHIPHLAHESSFINLNRSDLYNHPDNDAPNILVAIPWMTFGGAETLIYNYCIELKDEFNMSFVTGMAAEHEWEYKFKEITERIYHLANLFEDKKLFEDFISNYITTQNIQVLHIIHTDFVFDMLPSLRTRHPKLRVVVTMFNDRVEYFLPSVAAAANVDVFVTDNSKVADSYKSRIQTETEVKVIPNGVNCYDKFNPKLYGRQAVRQELGLQGEDLAVFFVGRLSIEKNPDVFIDAAKIIAKQPDSEHIRFFVIGDGPMKGLIERSATGRNVSYLGYQSDVARLLCAADIFVLPSSIEGFPMSILEAMAMGVAVVASDVGAVAEVIESGKDGFVVTPGSSSEIAEVITRLAASPKLLEEVQVLARKKVENKYSNTILGENYKALYEDLL